MTALFERLLAEAGGWKQRHFAHGQYPVIGEILDYVEGRYEIGVPEG